MLIAWWLLLGVLLASGFVALARTRQAGERRFFAVGLVVVALIYVGLATVAGAFLPWVAWEILGAGLYGAAVWLGVRGSLWWLASGWAAHPVWDVWLHFCGAGSAFTPAWLAIGCVSFDLLVAGYLGVQAWARPDTACNPEAQKP